MNSLPSARWMPLAIAGVGALFLLMAGTGTRMGLWSFSTGFSILTWAAYIGIVAALAAIAMLVVTRPKGGAMSMLVAALLIGTITAVVPWQQRQAARAVPPIHDITTDLGNPPTFVAILPLRADAPNSAVYEGEVIAAQQRAAYPDIEPLFLEIPPGAAFANALGAARDLGWEVVSADSGLGRIEATATTRWFGFKDDVVVRIAEDGSRTRVDVRSVSRVGRSDAGANAARIRAFLARMAP